MILVTGGNGLVGSHLIYYLTQREEKIKVLLRDKNKISEIENTLSFYTSDTKNLLSKIECVEGDISDYFSLQDAIKDVTRVYHTAAFVSFNSRLKYKLLDTNVKGTANIVNLCLLNKIEKLCYVSSIGALGESENGNEITEDTFWKPTKKISTYSLSKYYAEMEVWRGITEGLNAVILNPSVIIGPGNWHKGSPALVKFLSKEIKFYTPGVTGYVDVNDVCWSLIQAMDSNISGERIILNSENRSYFDLFKIFAEAFNNKPPEKVIPKYLLNLIQKFESLRSILFNKEPRITRDTVRISQSVSEYSNKKSIMLLNIKYKPFNQSVYETIKIYKNYCQHIDK